jgi:hypothetical protein
MPKRKAEAEPSMSDLMTLVKTLVDQNKVLEGKLEQQTDQLNQLKQGQGALAQNQAVLVEQKASDAKDVQVKVKRLAVVVSPEDKKQRKRVRTELEA